MGTISYLGHFSILEAFPVIAAARGVISVAIGSLLPEMSARLAGALRLQASLRPPSLGASIALATKILANVKVSVAPPGVNFTMMAQLIARLRVTIEAMRLALAWGVFPGSVHVYVYQGAAGDMGPTISAAVSGGMLGGVRSVANVIAPFIVVETSDAVALASIRSVMKVA
jgi:hypothetical protein